MVQKGRNEYLLNALRKTVEKVHESIEIVIPEMEPVYGAVMLAMDHQSIPVTEEIHHKFITYGGYEE